MGPRALATAGRRAGEEGHNRRRRGDEVFKDGPGFRLADQFSDGKNPAPIAPTGDSWLCEHAVSRYVPAWHQSLGNGHVDAAVATTGLSRWHNYYIEGLRWLVANVGIDRATMIGYWDPACPVKTGREDVLATAYVRQGKTLVAMASWAKEPIDCRLAIDLRSLGLDPAKAVLRALAIPGIQEEAAFKPGDPIPVPPGRGWILIVE